MHTQRNVLLTLVDFLHPKLAPLLQDELTLAKILSTNRHYSQLTVSRLSTTSHPGTPSNSSNKQVKLYFKEELRSLQSRILIMWYAIFLSLHHWQTHL